MMYQIPEQYYFRLHHVRPRFKNKIESVLIYVASEIAKVGQKPRQEFINEVNRAIRLFPGNATSEEKTINNWRTEISALFGFIQTSEDGETMFPGKRALELADHQDLVQAFKVFLYFFQYPGGHIKTHEASKIISAGIRFKPANYILKLLMEAEKIEGGRTYITKAELTHCVFNDLRITRDHEPIEETWARIKANRYANIEYDWNGDVVRYAGDILDYMGIANLVESFGEKFYINWLEKEAVIKFIQSEQWFSDYEVYYGDSNVPLEDLHRVQISWFNYVNQELPEDFFATDLLAFLSSSTEEYNHLRQSYLQIFNKSLEDQGIRPGTKQIGDVGENLIHGHECQRVKIAGREDLVHLIQWIPTAFALGYDIKSVEVEDGTQRLIEVKTTVSSKELDFTKFHLTTNEWSAASSYGQRYFVYRLMLSKDSRKLFLLKDPVGLYKQDKVKMIPRDGADISFDPNNCGEYTPLLEWQG